MRAKTAGVVVLYTAPILVMASLGWGGGGLGPRDPEYEEAFTELLRAMEAAAAEQLRMLDALETLLTVNERLAMDDYDHWLAHLDQYLFRIAGSTHRSLTVSQDALRDYYDRHEDPLDAARAILLDLNFPTDLLNERSGSNDDGTAGRSAGQGDPSDAGD